MGRMRTLGRLAVASSDELTLGQQVAKWGLDGTIGAVVSFVLSAVIGWVVGFPLSGLVIGAVLGMVIVAALTYKTAMVAISSEESVQPRRLGTRPHVEGEANDSDLPFPLPRALPPDWQSKQTLFNLSFRLVDLLTPEQALSQTGIQDKTFYRCTIHGPAILCPTNQTRFTGESVFFDEPRSGDEESMWYELDPDRTRTWFTGVVGTERCVFRDCTFVDIGVLAEPSQIPRLKNHIAGGGDVGIPM